ncbi:MAG: hypothetical protein ACKVP0_24675 [Pirellulaceae bacterium]
MKEIKPYKTLQGAKAALDNGGRFFNLWARAGDDRITTDELTKAAGAFGQESIAFLFLDMALADLPEEQREQVTKLLTPKMAARYRRNCPNILKPSQAGKAKPGTLVIVEGVPIYAEEAVQKRRSFIFVGKVMVPIVIDDHYQTYDLNDALATRSPPLPMIMARQAKRLEEGVTRFGGLLKEFTLEGNPKKKGVYFEPVYFTRLETKPGK